MKTQSIAFVAGGVIIGVVLAMLLRVTLLNPTSYQKEIENVSTISGEFNKLDETYFNSNSINPTKDITINPGQNTAPFGQ